MEMRKAKFQVSFKDSVDYIVEANTPEEAIKIALEWWDERIPYITVVEEDWKIFFFFLFYLLTTDTVYDIIEVSAVSAARAQ